MANIDARKDTGTNGSAWNTHRTNVVQRYIGVDTDNYKGTTGVTDAGFYINDVGAGDTVQILNIPAGTFVSDLRVEVLQLGTGNLSVGDSSSGTVFVSAQSIGSTGYIATMAATSKFYATANYILLTFASANDGTTASQMPILKVSAVFVDHSTKAPAATFDP